MANLAYGRSGSDVRALQEALRKAGYNIAADGVYGAETQNAVRQYQSAQGLGVDGIAGQQTFGALGIGSGGGTAGGGGYNNSGLTTDQIVEMQNYYGTKADGLWGQNSTAAAGGLNAQQAWQQYQQQKECRQLITVRHTEGSKAHFSYFKRGESGWRRIFDCEADIGKNGMVI